MNRVPDRVPAERYPRCAARAVGEPGRMSRAPVRPPSRPSQPSDADSGLNRRPIRMRTPARQRTQPSGRRPTPGPPVAGLVTVT